MPIGDLIKNLPVLTDAARGIGVVIPDIDRDSIVPPCPGGVPRRPEVDRSDRQPGGSACRDATNGPGDEDRYLQSL